MPTATRIIFDLNNVFFAVLCNAIKSVEDLMFVRWVLAAVRGISRVTQEFNCVIIVTQPALAVIKVFLH